MSSSSYTRALAAGELKADPAQEAAAAQLDALAAALRPTSFSLFRARAVPNGLYIWGDVGRGKTMLMDQFFADAPEPKKRRLHFNAFMRDVHARIHALRSQPGMDDPIAPLAREIAKEARLLCFDEFQVTDVADAMILGRLFEQFFAAGMVIVATSNTPPKRLYEGGLNRQLFLPFIAQIKAKMAVVTLNGPTDYRLQYLKDLNVYMTPLSPAADAAMDAAWAKVAGGPGRSASLAVLGRSRRVALTVNQFFTTGKVVAHSDLLTVLPRHFLNVTGFESELLVRELPFEVPPIHVDSLWHRRHDQDGAHTWLRAQVHGAAVQAFAPRDVLEDA